MEPGATQGFLASLTRDLQQCPACQYSWCSCSLTRVLLLLILARP